MAYETGVAHLLPFEARMRPCHPHDSRSQKTLAHIRQAFDELVKNGAYEGMTVSALCKRAGIGRKTFYVYYSSLDDLLDKFVEEVARAFCARIASLTLPGDCRKMLEEFYSFVREREPVYEKVLCGPAWLTQGDRILQLFTRATVANATWFPNLPPFVQDMTCTFIFSVGVTGYRQWVEEGKKTPLAELLDWLEKILTEGLNGLAGEAARRGG